MEVSLQVTVFAITYSTMLSAALKFVA